jgi:hypothetical protein
MINPVLDIAQLRSIIVLIFRDTALKFDRILKNTGKYGKSCWVSYWNGDRRWSTFISKLELQKAFWRWLCFIRVYELDDRKKSNIGSAIHMILQPGDPVFKKRIDSMGTVLAKRILPEIDRQEILVHWGKFGLRWESAVYLETFF